LPAKPVAVLPHMRKAGEGYVVYLKMCPEIVCDEGKRVMVT
jgi:hypothetical protein